MIRKFLVITICFLLFGHIAHAQLTDEAPKVQAKLIARQDGIKAGEKFWVALRQDITPGWHTYWRNPGDTGLATTIKWDLPDGFKASEILFPTPHKQPTGELVNYGYSDAVLLPVQITVPDHLKTGEIVTLKAKASWLVCQDICIPESKELSLDMTVMDSPGDGPWASAFKATWKTLPHTHKATQTANVSNKNLVLTLDPLPLASDELPEEAYFFPHDGLLIQHNAKQTMTLDGRGVTLTVPLSTARSTPVEEVTGDLWVRTMRGERSFTFRAQVETDTPIESPAQAGVQSGADDSGPPPARGIRREEGGDVGFFGAVFFAFLGGILLNLMPCVFPVLSLKALGLVQKSHHESRHHVRVGGVAYLLGVLATFSLLGIVLIAMKVAGAQIGWGVQLQSPVFVASMAVLLFLIGYVLLGGVTIGTGLMGLGQKLTQKSGHAGSFFTGALAVVVATPCTAPFMGGAVFYALSQNAFVTLLVLWALGLGLALPYVLLTLFPKLLLQYLPKPGVWMEHFKQFLAFPMWAAAVWLIWVLGQQTGATGVLYALGAVLLLGFGFWLWRIVPHGKKIWRHAKRAMAVLAFLLAAMLVVCQPRHDVQLVQGDADAQPYSVEKLTEARSTGRPVLVNMTAAWCITCLANEKAALGTEKVRGFFKDHDVLYLKGDWTNYDPAITSYLKEFGRSGVPLYVFYPGDQTKKPIVLPQLLTPGVVIDHIQPAL